MVIGSDIVITASKLVDSHVPHIVSPLVLVSELQCLIGTRYECVETILSLEVLSVVLSDLCLVEVGVLTRGECHSDCSGNKCRHA